jgi:hypothetical protein
LKKKILVIALIVAMLATPLLGAVKAGYGGKNKATFQWYVVQWPLPSEDTKQHTIVKEGGNMWIVHNLHTFGVPPVPEVTWIPDTFIVAYPTWGDYPAGGIKLTVTQEGEDPYTLVGTFEKTMLYIMYNPKGGILENSKWSFTITGYEGMEEPPEGYMGSTMHGTIKNFQGGTEMAIKSTKGTGIFEGAFLRGTHITIPGFVFEYPDPSSQYMILSTSIGSGEIVFP